jgi:formylglycine-generating enzyme
MMSIARPRLAVGVVFCGLLFLADCKRHGGTWRGAAPSCKELPATCGAQENDDCCKSLPIPGGTFNRSYDDFEYTDRSYTATVSDFYLDKYEITLGRFRAFVNAGMGTQATPPGEGTGAHPKIAGSGWDPTWNTHLPANPAALKAALRCDSIPETWTDRAGSDENKPIGCLDWYGAFAFCAWDGGRLPTEAEWNYASSGGSEHRYYPWSIPGTSRTIDDSYAVHCGGACTRVQNVGTKSPKGDAKWGQADMGGNVWEWTLDWRGTPYPTPCDDCAQLKEVSGSYRAFRGGSFDDIPSTLRSAPRHVYHPGYRGNVGARCARNR